jgi:hypothetical protein
VSDAISKMAFHRLEPAGLGDIDGKPERVSELARANQTPYNSVKICVICG